MLRRIPKILALSAAQRHIAASRSIRPLMRLQQGFVCGLITGIFNTLAQMFKFKRLQFCGGVAGINGGVEGGVVGIDGGVEGVVEGGGVERAIIGGDGEGGVEGGGVEGSTTGGGVEGGGVEGGVSKELPQVVVWKYMSQVVVAVAVVMVVEVEYDLQK